MVHKMNNGLSRRIVLKGLAGSAATGLAIPAIVNRAFANETLVVYNFDGVIGKFVKENWIDPFAKAEGVRIDVLTMQGSSPPMAKIKAQVEAGRPDADVIPMQLTDYAFAVRNNMLMPIGRDEIPEYANLFPEFVTDHGPGLILWCYGLAYNTKHITERPKRWKEMWDPAYKGKVALNEALFEQAVQMANLVAKGKPTPVDKETFAELDKLRPNLATLWTTGAQAEQLLRTEEVWLTPCWNGRVFTLQDNGVPVDFVTPEEGFFVRYDPYCIPRGAKNPALAKRWLNYICNADRQKGLADQLFQGTPNMKVSYTPDIAKRVVITKPEDLKLAVNEDYAAILDHLGEWRRMWDAWKQG